MPLPAITKIALERGSNSFPQQKTKNLYFLFIAPFIALKGRFSLGLFLPFELQVESPVECVEYEECDRVCDLDSPLHGVGQPLLEVWHVWVRGPGGRGARRGDGGRVAVATGAQLKKRKGTSFLLAQRFFASKLEEARYIFFLGGEGSSEMI